MCQHHGSLCSWSGDECPARFPPQLPASGPPPSAAQAQGRAAAGRSPPRRSLAVFRCEGPRDATRCHPASLPGGTAGLRPAPPRSRARVGRSPDLSSLSSSLTSRPVDPAPQPLPPICQPGDKGWPWAGTGPASWPQAARVRSPPLPSPCECHVYTRESGRHGRTLSCTES